LENRAREFEDAADGDAEFLSTPQPAIVPQHVRSRSQRLRLPLLIAAPVVAIVAAVVFYLHGGRYQSTDNAYLQSGLVSVGANVSGQVVSVAVRENQLVRKGEVLFTLDPAPFQAAVDEAAAALADARTQVGALRASYRQGQAELQAARDKLTYAVGEAARQKELLAEGISSQAQYDQALLAQQTARQGIVTSQQQTAGVLATLSGRADLPADQQPTVKRMQAALDRAKLNLTYSVVRASQDGIVTKVNQLQVGDYVAAARPVFTLAGMRIWVEANFKENQLDHMRVGQPATIKVDAFPSLHLTGHLTSFSPGTGNSFALLPPENATGNWVKVVQRLPVQFAIDKLPQGIPLHAGLSVEVTTDTGYQRHLFGAGAPATR
jgi:membrane fusion protein (multidrug efflux system)